jgi:hypothetical protein
MTQVAQVGGPVTRGAGWFVPSATGSWGSFVDMSAQKFGGHVRRFGIVADDYWVESASRWWRCAPC